MKYRFILIVFIMSSCASPPSWESVHTKPTQKPAQVYGSYSAGCLDGGQSLPYSGEGYQFVKISRQRFYGHPKLLNFLKTFGKNVSRAGHGKILIADLAQPRGGPMPTGHASHQVGLDADIYFERLSAKEPMLTLEKSVNIVPTSTLNEVQDSVGQFWTEEHARVLKMAATEKEVERIFVHYVIKQQLCQTNKGEPWLSKIRPWWGHHYHFHVRLSCPADSPSCVGQPKPASGDGCDADLKWWFTDEAQKKGRSKTAKSHPVLPKQCERVFNEVL